MELVTEPVITSAKQAGDFARELQLLLRSLKVSDANTPDLCKTDIPPSAVYGTEPSYNPNFKNHIPKTSALIGAWIIVPPINDDRALSALGIKFADGAIGSR